MAPSDNTNGRSILILEDDAGICKLEADRLQPLGREICCVSTATEASDILKRSAPELLIIDYSLPGTDAITYISGLKKSAARVPPFMVVTGRGDEAVAVAAMKAGACDYIVKNADFLDNLLPAAQKALEKISLMRDLEAAQKSTARNLHLYTFLAQINQAASRVKEKKMLLQKICSIAVETGKVKLAWVGAPDPDLNRLFPMCWAGSEEWFIKGLRVDTTEGPYANSPMGVAARTKTIVEAPDILAEKAYAPWHERVAKAGFNSSAAIPLMENGRVSAVLGLYSTEKNFFGEEDMKLLAEIQADVSLALEAISAEEKRARAQADLERTSGQLAHIMDVTPVILFKLSNTPPGEFSADWVSGNAERITGYSPEELLTPTWWVESLHPDDRDRVMKEQELVLHKSPLVQDFRLRKKDGTYLWVHSQLNLSGPGEVTGSWTDITRLKESEGQMRLLNDAINTSFDEVYIFSPKDFRFIFVNKAALNNLGYPEDEITRLTPWDLKTEFTEETFRKVVEKLVSGEQKLKVFETLHRRKDGSSYPVEVRLQLVDSGGEKVFLAVINDITQQQAAEEAARLNEARLESLDRINAYQYKNIQDLLDYTLQEAISLTGSRLGYIYHYDEDKKEFTLNTWSKEVMAECGVPHQQTTYKLEKTGVWGDVVRQRKPVVINDFSASDPRKKGLPEGHAKLSSFMSIPVAVGASIVAVVGVANKPSAYTDGDVRQLTLLMDSVWKMVERREAREKIEESQASLKTLVDSAPDGILVRRGRKIVFINRTGLEMLKSSSEKDFIGRDLMDRLPSKYASQVLERMRLTEETGAATPPMEIEYMGADNSLIDLEITGAPITFEGEKCSVVFARDISQKKKNDLLIREMSNMQRVESLGALAGGIAHDFNNMLTGIMANLSLLASKISDREAKEIIHDTLEASRNAQTLTSQLLAFSKGGKPVKNEFCLEKALKEIYNLATRGVKCSHELQLPDNLWSVEGDENQIKQAVNNLLVNGLQAMPSGGQLTLKAENRVIESTRGLLAPGDYVVITVSDAGIGIPKEYLPRIFEPYFTTKSGGHGLGLAMTWSVVKNHGGHMEVKSEPGKGTTFELTLPSTGRCLKEAAEKAKAVAKGTGRVLLLEDEALLRRAAERMLGELGYSFESTAEGSATLRRYAEEKAAGRPFDAVIMDLTIPGGMGGKEAVKELRKLDPHARVIVSSGYSDEAVMSDYKAYGFDAVLPKPYRYEDLAEALTKLLGSKK